MQFSEDDFFTLANFFGYGQAEAEVWILGMEEKGDPSQMTARLSFEQVMGKEDGIDALGLDVHNFDVLSLNQQGLAISTLLLQFSGKNLDLESATNYFSERLFSADHNSLFIPFYPIPADAALEQDFGNFFPIFKDHATYLSKTAKIRGEFLNEAMAEYKPKLLLAIMKNEGHFPNAFFEPFNLNTQGFFDAGWDTDTVVIRVDDLASLSGQQLRELAEFIEENCLPIDPDKDFGPVALSVTEQEKLRKEAAKAAAFAKRKNKTKHNPADPYCVCEECLNYDK